MSSRARLFFLLLCCPLLIGCDGCRQVSTGEAEQGQEEAERDAFTIGPTVAYPPDQSSVFQSIKPGHWSSAEQSFRSNLADVRGELASQLTITLRNSKGEAIGDLASLKSVRPVTLPEGQMRRIDFRMRCPIPNAVSSQRATLSSRLTPRTGGILETGGQPLNVMVDSEYFFVVLTTRPEQFTRLQVADWVRTTVESLDKKSDGDNYRVVVPTVDGLIALPETVLDMTSIGVIFWDDVSEDALTPAQQTALSDWLHLGGRLIVNGPSGSEAFANSSLADALPLKPTSNIELSGDAAEGLLRSWSVASDRSVEKQVQLVQSESSRVSIDGRLSKGASSIDQTESLVLRKRLGRGQVIQPRFDLTSNWVTDWESYDSFFSGVILGRPPRQYKPSSIEELDHIFVGTDKAADAAVNTNLRIAARDLLLQSEEKPRLSGSDFDDHHRVDAVTGLGAWADDSDVVSNLRRSIQSEAGIEIPGSDLVLRSLAIYLVLLVPANYLVFRLLNRLEYAWFAVPVLAILGAVFAARQARLDIGFARSNTELSFLEVPKDYPRAHLTRLVGIYNSLSSSYELQFKTLNGIASPLAGEPDPGTTVLPEFRLSFEEGPSLADFSVLSNRMRYAHCEEIVELGGAIRMDEKGYVINETDYELLDVFVVQKEENAFRTQSLGMLGVGEGKEITWSDSKAAVPKELPMKADQLMAELIDPLNVPSQTTRLIARMESSLPGLEITPSASQTTAQTVVMVHLEYQPPRDPKPDVNLITDFRRVNRYDGNDPAAAESSDPKEPTEETP
ncbi:MAG: hypothetical protein AAFV88_12770 [Planctomycetota bacterium]